MGLLESKAENIPDLDPTRERAWTFEKLFELISVKGLSYAEAGKYFGISKQSVYDACKRHGIEQRLSDYKKHRADILAGKGRMLLYSMTDEDIKKAPLLPRLTGYGILYDKERLERGQSTENIDAHHLLEAIDKLANSGADVAEQIEKLEKEV